MNTPDEDAKAQHVHDMETYCHERWNRRPFTAKEIEAMETLKRQSDFADKYMDKGNEYDDE